MTLCYACGHDGETVTERSYGTLPERELCVDESACWKRVRSYRGHAKEQRAALDRARTAADLITPLLLSHYEHALDEADATQRHARPVPAAQRAIALRRARALRDVLTALGAENADKAMRDERLARIEAGSETP